MKVNKDYILSFIEKSFNQQWMPPHSRGLLPFLKRKLFPQPTAPDRRGTIVLTTACNLSCFSCAAKGGEAPPIKSSIHAIARFVEAIGEVYGPSTIHFTGGEPTLYKDIELAAKVVKASGMKLAMLTNGARLIDLSNFDYVLIDDHGTNSINVMRYLEHIKKYPDIITTVKDTTWHQDTAYLREGNITKGLRCPSWMTSVMLMGEAIFPCCNIGFLDMWEGNTNLYDAMMESGWNVWNPNLADTIRNWRETLPDLAYKRCSIHCWKHSKRGRWRNIKDEDRNRNPVS